MRVTRWQVLLPVSVTTKKNSSKGSLRTFFFLTINDIKSLSPVIARIRSCDCVVVPVRESSFRETRMMNEKDVPSQWGPYFRRHRMKPSQFW
jgi:hypothetical protein